MPPEVTYDPAALDLTKIIADKEAIRRINPQRFEMEHLDAIVLEDPTQHMVAGYKDITDHEFWIRGHMPGYPLMPGVILCEAGAQLSSYYILHNNLVQCDFLGFGGMDEVRFRSPVHVGDRLVLVSKLTKMHRRQVISNCQGFVGNSMVFHAQIIGVPLSRKDT